jgi:prepilin-type processing-associated H-X9-DG protein
MYNTYATQSCKAYMKSYPDNAGFSQVDLLTVLAVLGGFALLAPILVGDTRHNARTAVCIDQFRQLTRAWMMYAADHRELLPPNPDDGNTLSGHNWSPGNAGRRTPFEFNPDILKQSMLMPYAQHDVSLFRCPADDRVGLYQGTDPARLGTKVPAARSIAMNHAVGTVCATFPAGHSGAPILPTHGPWLNNTHSHSRGAMFRTFGKLGDFVAPGPASTWVLIDEDVDSLNDGGFALGMVNAEWIDWPGTRHDLGATISFADGRVELRRWVDSRTIVLNGMVTRRPVPGSEDYEWLRDRTSAAIQP